MILGRYLQQRRERRRVALNPVSYLIGDVLVDKQNSNVLALGGKFVECRFDGRVLRLCVHDEEVLLSVWGRGNVLERSECTRGRWEIMGVVRRRPQVACQLLCPAAC
jgi:hypothetical protein